MKPFDRRSLDMRDISLEVRRDGAMLVALIGLLEARTPITAWPGEIVAALAEAIAPTKDDPRERGKAERLERHLFVGAAPSVLADATSKPSRKADRIRADLADLTPYGAGLHLVDEGS